MNTAPKTVIITGASTGIGMEAALYFYQRGWNTIATLRNPEKRQTSLHDKGLPDLRHLDVTDPASIQSVIRYTLDKYQKIDVLVNNAGYAVYGPFEATNPQQLSRQFDTNVFGLMEVTRQILPTFRQQKSGVLINIASMGGRIGFPLYSLYNSTKWAVEGFSEALQYELKPLNIRVKLIEPGVIKTDFYDRSLDTTDNFNWAEPYGAIIERGTKRSHEHALHTGAEPHLVAQTIYQAATDGSLRLRYIVGKDACLVSFLRRFLPEGVFYRIFEKAVLD
ncbi:MAG: SDR family oxidoreductase [Anaerolineales bacterium]|nr:SDR family oxidoreductase [Anaerolineales bacterium]